MGTQPKLNSSLQMLNTAVTEKTYRSIEDPTMTMIISIYRGPNNDYDHFHL